MDLESQVGAESEAAITAAVPIAADYVRIRSGQVHRRVSSPPASAGPPLYALHATAYSGRTFEPLMRALPGRRVVALDAPGYGASDRPPEPWPLERYVDALEQAVEAGGDGEIDLFGYHTGALFAVELAARRPALVRRLVLIGVPYFPAGPAREERRATLAAPMRLSGSLSQFDERWAFFVSGRKPGVTLEQGFANFVDELRAWPYGFWAHEAAFTCEPGPALKAVRQPTLVLNPRNHLAEPSRQAAALMPNARVEDVAELQDAVLDVGAEVLAPRIEAFLK